jgi:hypothetical protein
MKKPRSRAWYRYQKKEFGLNFLDAGQIGCQQRSRN